jgi:hypothetical protein
VRSDLELRADRSQLRSCSLFAAWRSVRGYAVGKKLGVWRLVIRKRGWTGATGCAGVLPVALPSSIGPGCSVRVSRWCG